MGRQYDRAFTLTLGGKTIASLSGDPDNSLRVRFKIQAKTTQSPNYAQVIVTNLSDTNATSYLGMLKDGAKLELTAGYVDNSGLIFSGDGWYGIKGRESPTDTTLQLFARDGGHMYDYAVVNKSLAAGSTPNDHLDTHLQAMAPFGITKGYAPNLSLPQSYPRGVSLFGMVKDRLRELTTNNQCTWSVQNGQLFVVPTNGNVPGAPYVLNSSTGLIGMPTQTPAGIMARCLINPALNCGSGQLVQIAQSDIQGAVLSQATNAGGTNDLIPPTQADGQYRIVYMEVTGDSRGNDWYQDLTCLPLLTAANQGVSSITDSIIAN